MSYKQIKENIKKIWENYKIKSKQIEYINSMLGEMNTILNYSNNYNEELIEEVCDRFETIKEFSKGI